MVCAAMHRTVIAFDVNIKAVRYEQYCTPLAECVCSSVSLPPCQPAPE